MVYRFSFSILIFLISAISCADIITEKCASISQKPCVHTSSILPIDLVSGQLNLIQNWTWFYEKIEKKKKILQGEVSSNVGMFRYLSHDFIEDDESRDWYENKLQDTRADFDRLKIILDEISVTTKQLNLCYKLCGPVTRIEKEEKLKKLIQLKMILLTKNPILASPQIEELISKEKITDKEFKNTLGESYSSYLIAIKDQIKSLDDEFGKQAKQLDFIRSSPSKGKEVRSNYFLDMLEGSSAMTPLKSELISEIDWHSEIQNSNNPSLSCELYKKNREYIKSQKNKEIITEVGLVVLPLIAGPAFRVGAWGLRASGLVKWGMRDELYINATRAISASSSSGVFVNELYRTVATSEKCSNSLNSFIEKSKQIDYQKYMQCNENLSNQVLLLALESAFVSGSGVVSALKTIELSRSYKKGETLFNVRNSDELHYYLETKSLDSDTFGDAGLKLTTKKGDYFVLNLNGPQSEVKDLSDNYWNYVADTYKKRLNLSDAEINGFIESSAKMSDRTTLIVSTPHNSRNTFRGGVALVSSKKADDLMPFEKATGINVKRVPGEKVGEIVRLTVSEKRGDRKLTNELVEQVISSIKGQDDMKKAYIYTSKSHQRLYQRMLKKLNIKATQINDLDRDVILELDVSDF